MSRKLNNIKIDASENNGICARRGIMYFSEDIWSLKD
jgi:hypothetical protein